MPHTPGDRLRPRYQRNLGRCWVRTGARMAAWSRYRRCRRCCPRHWSPSSSSSTTSSSTGCHTGRGVTARQRPVVRGWCRWRCGRTACGSCLRRDRRCGGPWRAWLNAAGGNGSVPVRSSGCERSCPPWIAGSAQHRPISCRSWDTAVQHRPRAKGRPRGRDPERHRVVVRALGTAGQGAVGLRDRLRA